MEFTYVPYRCPRCGEGDRFATISQLKTHFQTAHSKVYLKPHRSRMQVFNFDGGGKKTDLLHSLRAESQNLEERLRLAKENEIKNKLRSNSSVSTGVDYSYSSSNNVYFKDVIAALNQDVVQSRKELWDTANDLYHSQDIIQDIEVAAENHCKQQREIIDNLNNALKAKESQIEKASKQVERLNRAKEILSDECKHILEHAKVERRKLKEELNTKEDELESLGEELDSFRYKAAKIVNHKDKEIEIGAERIEALQKQQRKLVLESRNILKKADVDRSILKKEVDLREGKIETINDELEEIQQQQQEILRESFDLFKNADDENKQLKDKLKFKETKLKSLKEELERIKVSKKGESDSLKGEKIHTLPNPYLVSPNKSVPDVNNKTSAELEALKREQGILTSESKFLKKKILESEGAFERLEQMMAERESKLSEKDRELSSLKDFLQVTAEKETKARDKLEKFMTNLIDRADKAEKELTVLKHHQSNGKQITETDDWAKQSTSNSEKNERQNDTQKDFEIVNKRPIVLSSGPQDHHTSSVNGYAPTAPANLDNTPNTHVIGGGANALTIDKTLKNYESTNSNNIGESSKQSSATDVSSRDVKLMTDRYMEHGTDSSQSGVEHKIASANNAQTSFLHQLDASANNAQTSFLHQLDASHITFPSSSNVKNGVNLTKSDANLVHFPTNSNNNSEVASINSRKVPEVTAINDENTSNITAKNVHFAEPTLMNAPSNPPAAVPGYYTSIQHSNIHQAQLEHGRSLYHPAQNTVLENNHLLPHNFTHSNKLQPQQISISGNQVYPSNNIPPEHYYYLKNTYPGHIPMSHNASMGDVMQPFISEGFSSSQNHFQPNGYFPEQPHHSQGPHQQHMLHQKSLSLPDISTQTATAAHNQQQHMYMSQFNLDSYSKVPPNAPLHSKVWHNAHYTAPVVLSTASTITDYPVNYMSSSMPNSQLIHSDTANASTDHPVNKMSSPIPNSQIIHSDTANVPHPSNLMRNFKNTEMASSEGRKESQAQKKQKAFHSKISHRQTSESTVDEADKFHRKTGMSNKKSLSMSDSEEENNFYEPLDMDDLGIMWEELDDAYMTGEDNFGTTESGAEINSTQIFNSDLDNDSDNSIISSLKNEDGIPYANNLVELSSNSHSRTTQKKETGQFSLENSLDGRGVLIDSSQENELSDDVFEDLNDQTISNSNDQKELSSRKREKKVTFSPSKTPDSFVKADGCSIQISDLGLSESKSPLLKAMEAIVEKADREKMKSDKIKMLENEKDEFHPYMKSKNDNIGHQALNSRGHILNTHNPDKREFRGGSQGAKHLNNGHLTETVGHEHIRKTQIPDQYGTLTEPLSADDQKVHSIPSNAEKGKIYTNSGHPITFDRHNHEVSFSPSGDEMYGNTKKLDSLHSHKLLGSDRLLSDKVDKKSGNLEHSGHLSRPLDSNSDLMSKPQSTDNNQHHSQSPRYGVFDRKTHKHIPVTSHEHEVPDNISGSYQLNNSIPQGSKISDNYVESVIPDKHKFLSKVQSSDENKNYSVRSSLNEHNISEESPKTGVSGHSDDFASPAIRPVPASRTKIKTNGDIHSDNTSRVVLNESSKKYTSPIILPDSSVQNMPHKLEKTNNYNGDLKEHATNQKTVTSDVTTSEYPQTTSVHWPDSTPYSQVNSSFPKSLSYMSDSGSNSEENFSSEVADLNAEAKNVKDSAENKVSDFCENVDDSILKVGSSPIQKEIHEHLSEKNSLEADKNHLNFVVESKPHTGDSKNDSVLNFKHKSTLLPSSGWDSDGDSTGESEGPAGKAQTTRVHRKGNGILKKRNGFTKQADIDTSDPELDPIKDDENRKSKHPVKSNPISVTTADSMTRIGHGDRDKVKIVGLKASQNFKSQAEANTIPKSDSQIPQTRDDGHTSPNKSEVLHQKGMDSDIHSSHGIPIGQKSVDIKNYKPHIPFNDSFSSHDDGLDSVSKTEDTDFEQDSEHDRLSETYAKTFSGSQGAVTIPQPPTRKFVKHSKGKKKTKLIAKGGTQSKSPANLTSDNPPVSKKREEARKRRQVMFCVFMYLDTKTLCGVAMVCKEWKRVGRHPALWTKVQLKHHQISSKFLITISSWCTEIQHLTLQGLRPRNRRDNERNEEYVNSTRGSLQGGLEQLLMKCQNSLTTFRVIDCGNILTDRCLSLAGCYCRFLRNITFISATDPVGPEVLWTLGGGCFDVKKLTLPPLYPCQNSGGFNNKCLQVISQFFRDLEVLSIGGEEINEIGLVQIAKGCQRLIEMEFDHMVEMTDETASAICDSGFNNMRCLKFIYTPVTVDAIKTFHENCRPLQSIMIHSSIKDYFSTVSKSNIKTYEEKINDLKGLSKIPGYLGLLKITTDPIPK